MKKSDYFISIDILFPAFNTLRDSDSKWEEKELHAWRN